MPTDRDSPESPQGSVRAQDGPTREELIARLKKLEKINQVLMTRVESSMETQGSAFAIFQTAILLERKIKERTTDLEATLRDLAESNHQLELARAQSAASSQAKSEFLGSISREVREPLYALLSSLRSLLSTTLDAKQAAHARAARLAGESLVSLLNDILDYSVVDSGRLELEIGVFDLRDSLAETLDLVTHSARARGLAVGLEVSTDVPRRVIGDAERIREMLINLLSNAVSSNRDGRIALRVQREPGSLVRFEVETTGFAAAGETRARTTPPIPREEEALPRSATGSGLGFEIVRLLAARMSGSAGVESEPGRGNRFWFAASLPVAVEEEERAPSLPRPVAEAPSPAERRLLLAEDDPVNQKLTAYTLEKFGYHVDVVTNGEEALAALEKVPYELIFMDCQMPTMDGYRATELIRAREGSDRHTVIVALTANAAAGDRERCLACGMDDYIAKPFRPSQLQRVLNQWLKAPVVRAA